MRWTYNVSSMTNSRIWSVIACFTTVITSDPFPLYTSWNTHLKFHTASLGSKSWSLLQASLHGVFHFGGHHVLHVPETFDCIILVFKTQLIFEGISSFGGSCCSTSTLKITSVHRWWRISLSSRTNGRGTCITQLWLPGFALAIRLRNANWYSDACWYS